MNEVLLRCDKCEFCYHDKSKKYDVGWTHYCKLNNRDVGQSHFGHNSPRCCPLRKMSNNIILCNNCDNEVRYDDKDITEDKEYKNGGTVLVTEKVKCNNCNEEIVVKEYYWDID